MDVFDLAAKISLDSSEYEKGLDNAKAAMNDVADKATSFDGLGSKLKGIFSTLGKGAVLATGAAATGIGALIKSSVSAYGDYEQLVGGVDTLFKKSSSTVQKYAANAYKTAGMSANEYMTTVTSFSASLLQSLNGDTNKAAKQANKALTDMSDNVNKMGSNMEDVENAYKGFSKQNYTMLDNLKLGYGGTKEEMERLLKDAQKISGIKYDISSYSDIVDAIHVVQTEMGITGTTAKEASTTIQGSLSMTKSAIQNLIAGLGNKDADIGKLVSNVVDSTTTFLKNIIPVAEQALVGIGKMIDELLPEVMNEIPKLLKDTMPTITNTIVKLIPQVLTAITEIIPQLAPVITSILQSAAKTLIGGLPTFIDAGMQLLMSLGEALVEALPELVPQITEMILQVCNLIIEQLPLLFDLALQLIEGLVEGLMEALPILIEALPEMINQIITFILEAIPQIIQAVIPLLSTEIPTLITSIVTMILNCIPQIIQAGIDLLTSLTDALPDIISALVEAIPQIINGLLTALINSIPQIIQAGFELLTALINDLPEIILDIVEAIPQIINGILDAFDDNIDSIIDMGVELFVSIVENLPEIIKGIIKAIPKIIVGIIKAFGSLFGKMGEVGKHMLEGLWNGISNAAGWLWDKVSGWASDLWGNICGFFGIHSPSKLFENGLGKNLMLGMALGISSNADEVQKSIDSINDSITNSSFNAVKDVNSNLSKLTTDLNVVNTSTFDSQKPINTQPIQITFGDVTINNDDDIETLADKISAALSMRTLREGMAWG